MADCFNSTLNNDTGNLYKFDGIDKVCYNDCPDGYYGDPSSGYCVTECPNITDNHGYFVLGEICV